MCGIAGIIRADGAPVEPRTLGRMVSALAHRGPDEEGIWIDEGGTAGLGVRRLAVIDPPGSRQPMTNEDGSVHLAYNGEVYNYPDLRERLEGRGHRLASAGDTEVLVHLYEDDGPDLLAHLVGMFAFAIWDGRARRLLLARDRLGQKPLYWWHGPEGLAFASEPAALLECPDVPRAIDPQAIGAFLRFGCVPAPATGFAGIRKLEPAHYLQFDAAANQVTGPTRYWDIPRGPPDAETSPAAWRERLLATLSAAVRARLAADVPLGVLLSGGLDSSVVAALAAEHAGGRLRTFTVRFAESGWDESAYAREVADQLGTEHTEVDVEPRCVEALETLVRRHGEPFADSSAVAVYWLAREARHEVTVALSGDGGDESFGGYPRHAAMAVSARMAPGTRRLLARLGRQMPARAGRKTRWNAARRFLAALDLDPLPRYLAWRSLFSSDDLAALLAPEFAAEALTDDPLARWGVSIRDLDARPWVDRAMAIDLQDYLPNDCLAKVDIASMAHGLEVRSPLLDHRVVELARQMPVAMAWRRRLGRLPQGKAILRDAFSKKGSRTLFLPQSILKRGKMGFGVPVSRWLAGEHADWMRGILLDSGTLGRGLLRREAVEALIAAHTGARADHGERLWALLCLELWLREFLDYT
ncbi:MAG TPA: asparagine synthase (glutamine-hydrolyzing) [Phycisphaerae bacterium]|nr:asparagine synthase (glutamine-hydrolyzing) [Phycisphaerae bacterium]